MKKILYTLILTFMFLLSVNADTTKNGVPLIDDGSNSITLYCEYNGNHHILIEKDSLEGVPYVTPDGFDKYVGSFRDQDGNYDCPKYAEIDRSTNALVGFVNTINSADTSKAHYTLKKEESSCSGPCLGNQLGIDEVLTNTCDYSDAVTGNGLIYHGQGKKCTITYNDKNYELENSICAEINASNTCPDIFFNPDTQELKVATYDYSSWFYGSHNNYDPSMYNFVCGNNQTRYFCSPLGCQYKGNIHIDCSKITTVIGKSTICYNPNILKTFRFVGYLLFIAKLVIPLILIIMGSIDFGKAMISDDDSAVKKASNVFIRRVIASVIIFFIPTIVNFAFKGLLKFPAFSEYSNCRTCIFTPTKCNIDDK